MKRFTRLLRRLAHDPSGNVLMLTGLMFVILIAAGGAGIDFGRQQLIRTKLQQASDAGALAAASLSSLSPSYGTQDRENIALRYYSLNYPAVFLGKDRPAPTINGDRISVEAIEENVEAGFITAVNAPTLKATGNSVVQRAVSAVTNYDVMLVLDNSGSMASVDVGSGNYRAPKNRAASQSAAEQAYLNTYGANVAHDICPSYVPAYYSSIAQCESEYPPYALTADQNAITNFFGLDGSTRLNALRSAANGFLDQLLANTALGNRVGLATWSVGQPLDVLALTDDRTQLDASIDRMFALDSTNSTPALLEAEKEIDKAIAADAQNKRVRAVVFMTDGINTISAAPLVYSLPAASGQPLNVVDPNGCRGNPSFGVCAKTNEMSLEVCNRLKDKQVQVYTIAFGSEVLSTNSAGQQARAFLQACASPDTSPDSPHFFPVATAAELNDIFKQIVTQIQSLRITD